VTIPGDLLEPPEEPNYPPPLQPAVNDLPFGLMAWSEFEKLIVRLADRDADVEHAQRFGKGGEKQEGIDVFARHADGSYTVYQCRKVEKLTAADIRSAVEDFEASEWAKRASRFVFATSREAVRRELADAIVELSDRLDGHEPAISFIVWDAEKLAGLLKDEPALVRDFFGPGHFEAFVPEAARAAIDARLGRMEESLERIEGLANGSVRVYVFDWSPEQAREELAALARADADLFEKVEARIGNPPQALNVVHLLDECPDWLVAADARPWRILAAVAERAGEWAAASRAWAEAAARTEDPSAHAGVLLLAAVAADVGGDGARLKELLAEARELAPNHPRLALQDVDQAADGETRLAALARIETDEPQVAGLLACHRALAHLLVPDLGAARAQHDEARKLLPKSLITRMVGVNVDVQQGRIDYANRRPLDRAALIRAHDEAQQVLALLREQRRFAESVRTLMLAADALGLLHERKRALRLLQTAIPEELKTLESVEVLGDAALRALGWKEALTLTENAATSDGIERIRSTAFIESGTLPERREAAERLTALVEAGGREAPEAALVLLGEVLSSPPAEWNEPAAELLRGIGHDHAVTAMRAFYEARKDGAKAGYAVLEPHISESWALVTKLYIAGEMHDRDANIAAARELLALAPRHDIRVACGQGLAASGEMAEAGRVFREVAHDKSAPDAVRADACSFLVKLLGKAEDWKAAETVYYEWIDLRGEDERIPPWGPMIANRARD
jgi:tetratricopeptide (TPR) repeat protein